MTFIIPTADRKFSQPNNGDTKGNIYSSLGLDLKTNPGMLRLSPPLVLNTKDNDSGISGMGVPIAFATHAISGNTKKYFAACGTGALSATGSGKMLISASDDPSSAFANDVLVNTPTDIHLAYSDMVEWQTGLYGAFGTNPSILVSTFDGVTSQIKKLQGTWQATWFTGVVTSGTFRTQGGFKNLIPAFNRNIYFTDDDTVGFIAPATDGSSAPVATVAGANGALVTGTLNFNKAYTPIWGRSTSSFLVLGLMTYQGGSGSKGFIGHWDTATSAPTLIDIDAPCALSGCIIKNVPHIIDAFGRLKKWDGTGYTEIARLPVANLNIEMPGIYSADTNARWIAQRGMDEVDGKININVNNFVSTGIYVKDMPSGVWEYDPENPAQGLYHKNPPITTANDFGQQEIATAGAIFGSKRSTGTFLAGYGYYTDTITTRNGIFHDDLTYSVTSFGNLISPKLFSPNIEDTYSNIYAHHKKLINPTDYFDIKYRTSETDSVEGAITWVATNGFNTTADLSLFSKGDEVEILLGVGASKCSHIATIQSASAGVWIVTVDDTYTGASGTSRARFQKWVRKVRQTSQTKTFTLANINTNATWLQARLCMSFKGKNEIHGLIISNKEKTPIT